MALTKKLKLQLVRYLVGSNDEAQPAKEKRQRAGQYSPRGVLS